MSRPLSPATVAARTSAAAPATKLIAAFEPFIDPTTKKMDIGGFLIPPTNLLTALLYGFARHRRAAAREYYFWRVCDLLWNRDDLPEPMMVRHPWAERMISACIRNRYLAIGGAASTGKSHTMAAWGIVNCLSAPRDTLVLMTSTTLREARKRIWGSVISLLSVVDDAPFTIRDSIGNVAYVNEAGNLIERAGISLIAAEKSKTREAVGKFIGIKQKKVILIGDELAELSEAIVQAGLSNLASNPLFQLIGMSNPNSRFDAFGVWAQPRDGWDSVDTQINDEWTTKWDGLYIRLDGERSPNILAGQVLFPWLPTSEKLRESKELLGENSRGYLRMVRAVFFDSDEAEGIYSEAELARSGAMARAEWAGTPTPIGGCDPAFTNGGDRTILYPGLVGYDTRGRYVYEFGEPIHINDDATNKAVPRTYQIVRKIKEHCIRLGIAPHALGVDSTGAGSPFCDVLAGEWSPDFLRVSFGGKASDRRVSANSQQVGDELYVNRVSELWFVGKELTRTGQIRGIDSDLGKEMCGRNYALIKGASLRVRIESKPEYKQRLGMSPDLADAGFICLDVARQRFGLVAVDPLPEKTGTAGYPRPMRSIRMLADALETEGAYLP
jgi:hypothetical protein